MTLRLMTPVLVLYEATKNSVKEWKRNENEALRDFEFDEPITSLMTSKVIKDIIKEGVYAETWRWKAKEEEDCMQQGVAASSDSKELGGNATAAHRDTLKLIKRLLEYFGQQDDTLYSNVVQLQEYFPL